MEVLLTRADDGSTTESNVRPIDSNADHGMIVDVGTTQGDQVLSP